MLEHSNNASQEAIRTQKPTSLQPYRVGVLAAIAAVLSSSAPSASGQVPVVHLLTPHLARAAAQIHRDIIDKQVDVAALNRDIKRNSVTRNKLQSKVNRGKATEEDKQKLAVVSEMIRSKQEVLKALKDSKTKIVSSEEKEETTDND